MSIDCSCGLDKIERLPRVFLSSRSQKVIVRKEITPEGTFLLVEVFFSPGNPEGNPAYFSRKVAKYLFELVSQRPGSALFSRLLE